jgi:hypothetical protein
VFAVAIDNTPVVVVFFKIPVANDPNACSALNDPFAVCVM